MEKETQTNITDYQSIKSNNGAIVATLHNEAERKFMRIYDDNDQPCADIEEHIVTEDEAGHGIFANFPAGSIGFIITPAENSEERQFMKFEEFSQFVSSSETGELTMEELDMIVGGVNWKKIWQGIKKVTSALVGFIPVIGTLHMAGNLIASGSRRDGEGMMESLIPGGGFLFDALTGKQPHWP
ncbi:hypothetical protein QET93_002755 [Akkermansia sp. N21116]|jgi:hypothetical protein|uniref:hypothetical protein n=1 Tax=Akkermansia sp. N21116 TaxID=3040764 RepID=UPI00244E729A|nr:hypothetical protein [Akkermansia sp. N21116]WPX41026.1 hypothetical protein QET93_002755 [Akkermansia sp. N21116]